MRKQCPVPGCRRDARPGAACESCIDRLLAQAFGREREHRPIERLSAGMPELQTAGRRSAA